MSTNNTTIKLSTAQKSLSYKAYIAVTESIVASIKHKPESPEKQSSACAALASLVKSVHQVDVSGADLLAEVLIRLVSFKTRKADGRKWVKFNGIGSFNTWVKSFIVDGYEVESNAGKDPSQRKPRAPKTEEEKMASRKDATMNFLKSMSKEEREAFLLQLMGE